MIWLIFLMRNSGYGCGKRTKDNCAAFNDLDDLIDEEFTVNYWGNQQVTCGLRGKCGRTWYLSFIDWRTKGVVTKQLVDCEPYNCVVRGGHSYLAFHFIIWNGGINSENDYPDQGRKRACNKEKNKRNVVSIDSYAFVLPNDEHKLLQLQPTEFEPMYSGYGCGKITKDNCAALNDLDDLIDEEFTVNYWGNNMSVVVQGENVKEPDIPTLLIGEQKGPLPKLNIRAQLLHAGGSHKSVPLKELIRKDSMAASSNRMSSASANLSIGKTSRRCWTPKEERVLANALKDLLTDRNARNMRYKTWPFYKDWVEIFGKDRATAVKIMKTLVTMSPFLAMLNLMRSIACQFLMLMVLVVARALKKEREKNIDENDDRFIDLISSFCDKTDQRLDDISRRIGFEHDASSSRKAVFEAFRDLGSTLDREDMILVSHLIVNNTKNMAFIL
ncbi:hypothetical protein BUALT_Bualt14G0113300 [Buddleja alternifolia]|uniref:Peptidase C1A papain C-terminal domain-containing protein n=1 Tax=Buddleja alternifolia TaxID=168488 RepID=A0AAV6WTZ3_9LAMI|nr:hypothetical protein BUALT_Bualt14G0113300 [Buddleja alternifolia]